MSRSSELYSKAVTLMPGGVNSPVRAFRAVGGDPIYFDHAVGSKLVDADGKSYVDFVSSWGAIILGHANPAVNQAIVEAAAKGTSFGAPHEGEIRLAEEVLARIPSLDIVRFVNSGTEAALAVIRLARAATGRSKVIKFEGNYHGAVDSLLAKAGSGVATFGLPDSAGVPKDAAKDTLTARYNDLQDVKKLLEANKGEVAAIMVEPVSGNMGLVPPAEGFLAGLRELADAHGALLVVDEVMTGFRVSRGGATERFNLKPDLVMLAKVVGGGVPVGAYAGKKELMQLVAPLGPMYQAGTLSGNPIAMAAGYAALKGLVPEVYEKLESVGARLEKGLKQVAPGAQVQRVGSMISVFLTLNSVTNFEDAQTTDKPRFAKIFHSMLSAGFYLPPSALESWFLTAAHSDEDIDLAVEAFGRAYQETA